MGMKVSPEMEAKINLLIEEDKRAKARQMARQVPKAVEAEHAEVVAKSARKSLAMPTPKVTKPKPIRSAIRDGWENLDNSPAYVLAFDGASQVVGYAALTKDMQPIAFGVLKAGSGEEGDRANRLIDAVLGVARDYPANIVACEITKGIRFGLKSRSTDLATLARVQGRIVQCLEDSGRRVTQVLDTNWTKGIKKQRRAERLRLAFPDYTIWSEAGHDGGLDGADSIGLAMYCINQDCMMGLVAKGKV